MLVLKERIIGAPVMSLQTGSEIARTKSPIIDPGQLTIVAFYCDGPQLDVRPAVLHVEDIREVSPLGYIVDSAEVVMSPDDLVRLQQVLAIRFDPLGKQVIDDTGRKVGKVINYTTDTQSFYITQLHVQPSFWQSLGTSEVIIGRAQILEITDKTIVVKSPTVKETQQAAQPVPENPFRSRPTIEASHTSTEKT